MTTDVPMSASQESNAYNQLEIDSAPFELRTLLSMLNSPEISVDEVAVELRKVHNFNSSYLTEYVVPYSGMYVIFYVAQRFSRPSRDVSKTESDCIELFSLLVNEYGANPNSLDGVMKQSVLFYTSKYGFLNCCKELVEVLGVNASTSDIHCQTALFYAAREGHSDVLEWLVRSGGCDVNHVDRNGQTALFYASREDRFECVMKMINELGADPLLRDVYKKRARSYLKGSSHKRTFDFLTEIEKARDPNMSSSHRKLFLVRPDEPVGAAAMTLRQHKPYNPFHEEEQQMAALPVAPVIKRQRSSVSGTTTPLVVKPEVVPLKQIEVNPKTTPRSRFKIKAPLGQGGLESFEKEFPEFALWLAHGSVKPSITTGGVVSPNAKAPSRTPRTPAPGLTPQWVTVVSQLLRGPLWRYGPATIFHKPVLALPPNLGPKYVSDGVERKLTIDLSVVRKKLEKGKYLKLFEIDRDIRFMFQQAKELTTEGSDLAVLTRATEVYYEQQLAGSGLAAIIRQEIEQAAAVARTEILNPVV